MSRFSALRFGHFLPSLLLLGAGLLATSLVSLSEFFVSLFNVLPTLLLLLGGTFCMGRCQDGVCVTVDGEFHSVSPDTVGEFFEKEVKGKLPA